MTRLFFSERILLFLLIGSLTILIISTFFKMDNTVTVFNESNDNYEVYIIDFKNEYITTKNIDTIFKNDIEAVYTGISDKYNHIIDNNWYEMDKTIPFKRNIQNIEGLYKKKFGDNNLIKEKINIEINGIRLSKIRILTNKIDSYNRYYHYKVFG